MKHILKLTAVTVLSTVLLACQTHKPEEFELTIAHINDTHSAFEPVEGNMVVPHNDQSHSVFLDIGGHPRLLSAANSARAEAQASNTPFLFLHGGDAWQGSAYFLLNEGRMNADVLSRFGLDAMALGNHEFDLDNEKLDAFIDAVNFPLVATNIDASEDQSLADQNNLLPYVLYHFEQGQKHRVTLDELDGFTEQQRGKVVAIVGLVLEDMPNISPDTGNVAFLPMVESVQQQINQLHAIGVNKVVAVTHIGHQIDREVAAQVNGIDVIVGGHSHTLLGDFSHIGWEQSPVYASRVQNPNGTSETCVVQAGYYAQAIGQLAVTFDESGAISNCEGRNTVLVGNRLFQADSRDEAQRYPNHEEILGQVQQLEGIRVQAPEAELQQHIVNRYQGEMREAYGDIIGFVPENINHVRLPGSYGSDKHGSDLAPLIAYAQYRYFLKPEIIELTGVTPDFALIGAGGIRKPLSQGEIREGNISLEVLPFGSFLSVLGLTGEQVRALLDNVIESTLAPGAHAGKYPYGGNLRYTFEETEVGVAGEITHIEVNRGTLEQPVWEALQDEQVYQVVMSGYSAAGNDGWNGIYEAQKESSDRIDVVIQDETFHAYLVERVERNAQGSLLTIYEGQAPDCDAEGVECGLDALSVINFFQEERHHVLEIPYPVVTLERLEQ
ncbi:MULTISPECIES: bifunctional UDP-sugar hydrolase/5'-nucleotidase [Gammaproteobacteria]|uniref:bifunctional metallophosphatase/5'-nucleotidase n=1 Tax=Gammaproteobacteria TaxID=1236 RepID=UPI000DCF9E8C|nr:MULTISPECIES: bifunctional metallophosphatase/5'-nucleotidase [Gammaproteobacteria]RTE85802.1 bifunctional metallophosphatase/5'-nucleotidase [Aliidiomarina sp. B3213]TCZ90196.1 bifunctional metallophosphatase/5'-nucleotidase [Lysobacter sp. N42]